MPTAEARTSQTDHLDPHGRDPDNIHRVHLGVVPLLTATGAGSASQQSLGTVVFGGMIASTLLAIPFVPVFYIMIQRVSERLGNRALLRKGKTAEASPRPLSD